MNRYPEPHRSRLDENHTPKRDKTRIAAALATTSALLLAGSTASSRFDTPQQVPPVIKVMQYAEPTPSDFFEDITILSIDNPNDHISPSLSSAYLADSIEQAITGMSATLDGSIDVPTNIPVLSLSVDATTKHDSKKGAYACFDEDAVYTARSEALLRQGKRVDTLTPIIIQSDEKICQGPEDAAAYVKRDGTANGGVYYKIVFDRNDHGGVIRVLQHEQGHTIGLSHSNALTEKGSHLPVNQYDDRDIVEMLQSGDYGLAGHYKGDGSLGINEYSGTGTVMGGITGIPEGGDVYNFVEINQLNPNASTIRKIDATQAYSYTINTDPGAIRGIVFDIPAEHPLQALFEDNPITQMTIGLNATNGNEMATLAVIGRRANGATTSLNTGSFIPKLDYDQASNGTTIYRDSSLGIRIVATATDHALIKNNGEVELTVEPLHDER